MKALISAWNSAGLCIWCEKDKEGVTVEFSDGFLGKGQLCWSCLQKAVKVRSQQQGSTPAADQNPKPVTREPNRPA
ncbi:MAG TPA: hypothetical protein PLY87_05635 [Planctomycetaceae bacterium]|nr:hypothetical protein [Planctomycetaceae bacterium]